MFAYKAFAFTGLFLFIFIFMIFPQWEKTGYLDTNNKYARF